MPLLPEQHAWLQLISRLCDEQATPEELRSLREQLLADERLRVFYLEMLDIEASLMVAVGEQASAEDTEVSAAQGRLVDLGPIVAMPRQATPQEDTPPAEANIPHSLSADFARQIEPHRHPLSFLSVVAALTVVFLATLVLWIAPWRENPKALVQPGSPGASLGKRMVVARVIDSHQAIEQSDSAPTFLGAHLRQGQTVRLASGLVKIRFDRGAVAILEGPGQLRIDDENAGRLDLGKLVAVVEEPRAEGFAIVTPTATVTDLGTEFGIEVSDTQWTTVSVFRGRVAVQPQHAGRATISQPIIGNANQSFQVAPTGAWQSLAANRPTFARRLPVHQPRQVLGQNLVTGGEFTSVAFEDNIFLAGWAPVDVGQGKAVSASDPAVRDLYNESLSANPRNRFFQHFTFGSSTLSQTVTITESGGYRLSADFAQRGDENALSNALFQFELLNALGEMIVPSSTEGEFPPDGRTVEPDVAQSVLRHYDQLEAGRYTIRIIIQGGQGAVDNIHLTRWRVKGL